MLTGQLKTKVDAIWDAFWSGGIANPLEVMEQITYLLFVMLIDPDNGRSLAIALFETEEDLRRGDEVLNSMSPSRDDTGRRTSVETYEVAVDVRI
jgi:hypothetical protein